MSKPGIVIFSAVLNFVGAAAFGVGAIVCLVALLFGNALGISDFVTRQIQSVNLSLGLTLLFVLGFVFCATTAAGSVWVGVALLKGRKWAWYCQVTLSVLGLLGFPLGTLLNGAMLLFFFQKNVRDFFQV